MDELNTRKRVLGALLVLYRENDPARAQVYLRETEHIPLDKLKLAVRALIRTHRWPRCPQIADICETAKKIAGMDRQQYRAGHYLPPASEWPPEGQRHGIYPGTFESVRPDVIALPDRVLERLSDQQHHEEIPR